MYSTPYRWKQRQDDHCPRCGAPETPIHVWKCHGIHTDDLWKESVDRLNKWLATIHTEPTLHSLIISNLLSWHSDNLILSERSQLEADQDTIGWDYLLEGVTPLSWENHQHSHYLSSGHPYHGKRWTTSLIIKLWEIAWDIWELRNDIAHRHNHLALVSATDQRIQEELETGPPSPALSTLFSTKQQDILHRATLAYKQAWLRHIDTVRSYQNHTNASSTSLRQMRRTMRNFLSGTTSNTNNTL